MSIVGEFVRNGKRFFRFPGMYEERSRRNNENADLATQKGKRQQQHMLFHCRDVASMPSKTHMQTIMM